MNLRKRFTKYPGMKLPMRTRKAELLNEYKELTAAKADLLGNERKGEEYKKARFATITGIKSKKRALNKEVDELVQGQGRKIGFLPTELDGFPPFFKVSNDENRRMQLKTRKIINVVLFNKKPMNAKEAAERLLLIQNEKKHVESQLKGKMANPKFIPSRAKTRSEYKLVESMLEDLEKQVSKRLSEVVKDPLKKEELLKKTKEKIDEIEKRYFEIYQSDYMKY